MPSITTSNATNSSATNSHAISATASGGSGAPNTSRVRPVPAQKDSIPETQLGEVTVTGQGARQRMTNRVLGAERLELAKLAQVPMLFGENDLIKSITLMPGVHGEGDGSGGFEVRGGTAAQNLVQLDGITLYNPSHVMGIFSTFNDNVLGRATLYKGPIPATFGGATASVLETTLAPGDMERYRASLTVGILAAKVKAEGPVVKDRLSFAVGARRSYVDAFLAMVPEYRGTVMNFYDVTAKLRCAYGKGNFIDASFIVSHDNMAIKRLMGMYWGNIGGSVSWFSHAGDRINFTTTAAVTDYAPDMRMTVMDSDQKLTEYIRNYSINEKMRYTPADGHEIEAGMRSELLSVKSAEMESNGNRAREIRSGWSNALWVNYDGLTGRHVEISAGVRLSLFSALSQKRFHSFEAKDEAQPDFGARTYFHPEPRASIKVNLTPRHSIKAGAGVTTQYLHAIRTNSTSFPFDRYALTSAHTRPEKAVQYGLGYTGMTATGEYDWSAEAYYKDINHVYDYQDGRSMFSRISLESIILGGKGRSYGLELMARKNTGRLTGWVSYTLSHTQTRIAGINGGRWYDASNDRRHDLKITAVYELTDRWSLSGSWIYSSGQPLTAPDVKYELDGVTCYYYSKRNGYRTPATHRLDLSATYTRQGKKFTTQWAFGLYNAYCRYNPYVVYFEDDPTKPSGTRAVQQALFGLVPSVSYTLKY